MATASRVVVRGLLASLAVAAASTGTMAQAGLEEVIKSVKPSIVAVGSFRQTDNPPFTLRGTGFAVGDGTLVITNAHVASGIDEGGAAPVTLAVQARALNGRLQVASATLAALDVEHDLAVLRIAGMKLPPLKVRPSDTVSEGRSVAFSGFPVGGALGFAPATHRGIVSSITPIALPGATARQLEPRLIRQIKSGSFDIFQLDATAYPGNSGSPLFDAGTGEVIGVISMVLIKGTKESAIGQPTGITYAVPSNHVLELLRTAP